MIKIFFKFLFHRCYSSMIIKKKRKNISQFPNSLLWYLLYEDHMHLRLYETQYHNNSLYPFHNDQGKENQVIQILTVYITIFAQNNFLISFKMYAWFIKGLLNVVYVGGQHILKALEGSQLNCMAKL